MVYFVHAIEKITIRIRNFVVPTDESDCPGVVEFHVYNADI